jgi:hypothetical protein
MVISYWKPEVAVRLVTDFTDYPQIHGKLKEIQKKILFTCIFNELLFFEITFFQLCIRLILLVPNALKPHIVRVKGNKAKKQSGNI